MSNASQKCEVVSCTHTYTHTHTHIQSLVLFPTIKILAGYILLVTLSLWSTGYNAYYQPSKVYNDVILPGIMPKGLVFPVPVHIRVWLLQHEYRAAKTYGRSYRVLTKWCYKHLLYSKYDGEWAKEIEAAVTVHYYTWLQLVYMLNTLACLSV